MSGLTGEVGLNPIAIPNKRTHLFERVDGAVAVLTASLLFVKFNYVELGLSEADINLLAQQILGGISM